MGTFIMKHAELLGDNTGGEAVMLRPIKSQCVRLRISTRPHWYVILYLTSFALDSDLRHVFGNEAIA
jgi:hypothetical protein